MLLKPFILTDYDFILQIWIGLTAISKIMCKFTINTQLNEAIMPGIKECLIYIPPGYCKFYPHNLCFL